jgi:hypothetical protein
MEAESDVDVSNSLQVPDQGSTAASATGEPSSSVLSAALAGKPVVQGNMGAGSQGIGLMYLAGSSAGTSATSLTYHSEVDWSVNTSELASNNSMLFVGLLGANSQGDGTVQFQVINNGIELVDQTFDSFSAADAYFDDQGLELGSLNSGIADGSDANLSFQLDVSATQAGAVFEPEILVAAVPEPATAALVSMAAMGCLLRRKRT